MGTAVTLERYAEIRAEMERGALRDEVLARASITPDEWTIAQREWLERMGTEIERSRFELTNRYTLAFLERQRALAAAATPPSFPVTAPPGPAVDVTPGASPHAPDHVAPRPIPPPVALPSPGMAPAPPGAVAPAPPAMIPAATPSPGASPQRATTLPGVELTIGGSTVFGAVSPFTQPLPFKSTEAAAARPRPSTLVGGLVGGVVGGAGGGLPFNPSASPVASTGPRAPTGASPADATAARQARSSATTAPIVDPLRTTTTGTALPTRSPLREALPFKAESPAAGRSPSQPAFPAASAPQPGRQTPAAPGSTPGAPPGAKAAPTPAAMGGLTIEQHASLCAEIAHDPSRAADTLARYRVTAETKAELDAAWKSRFTTDATLEPRWKGAYSYYASFLARQRNRGSSGG